MSENIVTKRCSFPKLHVTLNENSEVRSGNLREIGITSNVNQEVSRTGISIIYFICFVMCYLVHATSRLESDGKKNDILKN